MDAIDFRTVDLNLLAPLRVLLVERHVTRSAEKLGISQPAMSASLARSRTLFRDQLLVRGAKGLVLTPRADQLLEQLDHVMAVIGEMVSLPMEFAPETSQRTFTLHGNRPVAATPDGDSGDQGLDPAFRCQSQQTAPL